MHLLIISHTPHYFADGRWHGWGATVREIDQLATLFDRVTHLATGYEGPVPASALRYQADNVRVVALPPTGGEGWRAKLGIVRRYPEYARVMLRGMRGADAVHVRCPANISLLAVMLLGMVRHPNRRWLKYAGNWRPPGREAWSYRMQRWWLEHGPHRSVVTVNGSWPGQPDHVRSFYNPCLTEAEWRRGQMAVQNKEWKGTIRVLFVGRLEEGKGVGRCLQIIKQYLSEGGEAHLDLVGDGPQRTEFEQISKDLEIVNRVTQHGWLSRDQLEPLYARSHVLLLPSTCSEGWPKVLSEGMAYGVVPLASDVSCIGQYLREFSTGRAIDVEDQAGFVHALNAWRQDPRLWKAESTRAGEAATRFTYEQHLRRVAQVFDLPSKLRTFGTVNCGSR